MGRTGWIWLLPVVAVTGCLFEKSATPLVPADPFSLPAQGMPASARATLAPAAPEVAARVEAVGRKVFDANQQTGLRRPLFRTIGAPQPEIFHVQTHEVDVTVGLVNQCKTEGELAAVLCQELGKMMAERELAAGPKTRNPEREPPPEFPIGTDYVGGQGAPDQTRRAELAKFEKERSRSSVPLPPPDPRALARSYLRRAGYAESNLDTVMPLLQAAALNSIFEKQLTHP